MAVLGARRQFDNATPATTLTTPTTAAHSPPSKTTPTSVDCAADDLRSKYDRMRHVFATAAAAKTSIGGVSQEGGVSHVGVSSTKGLRSAETPPLTMPNIVAAEMVKTRARLEQAPPTTSSPTPSEATPTTDARDQHTASKPKLG